MAIAPTFSTPWMRVSASRRSWRFLSETRCWLQRPRTEDKTYTYKGEVRSKRVVVSPAPTPHAPWRRWRRACLLRAGIGGTVSEGTKGPIVYAFARQRVTLCKEGLPERTVWLVIKRTLGASPRVLVLYQ